MSGIEEKPTNRNTPSTFPLPNVASPYSNLPPFPSELDTLSGSGHVPISLDEFDLIMKECLSIVHQKDPRISLFILNYVKCRDIKQAAIESGFTQSQGYHLRNKPDVHQAISKLTNQAVLRHGLDPAEIVNKMKEVMDIDPIEFENPDGTFKTHLSQIPPEARRAIKSFKCKNIWDTDVNGVKIITGQLISVEYWDKMKATELLGREHGLFKETKKVEHDIGANMRDTLLQSKERAERSVIESREAQTIDVTPKEPSDSNT